jgi:hypothetical protein
MARPYRAEMGEPPMPDEGAPGPLTRAQRMGRMVIGKSSDLTEEERKQFSKMPMEPVQGEEVGSRKMKSEVYKKKFAAGGSASSRADGCAQRGKTRGKFV